MAVHRLHRVPVPSTLFPHAQAIIQAGPPVFSLKDDPIIEESVRLGYVLRHAARHTFALDGNGAGDAPNQHDEGEATASAVPTAELEPAQKAGST